MASFYEKYLFFKLVMLFFVDAESQEVFQTPRMFWLPSDLSFSELNPVLLFFFEKLMLHSKLEKYEVVEKKIQSHEGELNFQEYSGYNLDDNLDEDGFIKIVFVLKKCV